MAEEWLLIVDASKFGVVRPAYFASLEDFDIVVTDDERTPGLLECHPLPTLSISLA